MSIDKFDLPPQQDHEVSGDETPKARTKKYIISFCFMLLLISITAYFIMRGNKPAEIFALLRRVSLPFVAMGIASILGSYVIQGLVIGGAASCVSIKLGFWQIMQYSFVGLFYSLITPSSTGGQPMQFYYMHRDKVSTSKTALILFITNTTFQIAVVILGIVMAIYGWSFFAEHKPLVLLFFLGLLVNLGMLFALVGITLSPKVLSVLIRFFIGILTKIHIIKHPAKAYAATEKFISDVHTGLDLIRQNKLRFVGIFFMSLVQLITYHAIPYFVYRAFGFTAFSLMEVVAINSTLFVAISYFPLPGTVGAAESGFLVLYKTLFGAVLVPAMLLSRFITFYSMLLLSGIISAYVQLRRPLNPQRPK